ncbi:MAG: hypothetical protein ACC628_11215 [Pirellulaceae bacterium]
MKPNPEFMEQIKKIIKPADTVLVMCRSGVRSAMAVDRLAGEGLEKVYNIIDGFTRLRFELVFRTKRRCPTTRRRIKEVNP